MNNPYKYAGEKLTPRMARELIFRTVHNDRFNNFNGFI